MDKKEVQQRVSCNGKPIPLNKFNWNKETNTFSSALSNLVLDFKDVSNCTFNTGVNCTFNTGVNCTFNTMWGCTFKTMWGCTFNTGEGCTFKTGECCTFKTGVNCTFNTMWGCTFNTREGCTFKTGECCTFNTGEGCTFKTGECCTFKTMWGCTFNTGVNCTFNTMECCTFKTGVNCTFNTMWGCTFNTGEECVIVNRNVFEVITPNKGDIIQICPKGINGHLVNGLYEGVPHIIADGILSKIISQKGDVYKVINLGETETSYIIKKDDAYSHGKTLKEAKDSLIYKISNRDTSKYKDYALETVVLHEEAIQMYMCITGSCSSGTRYFVEQVQDKIKSEYTISELIELTQGQYGNDKFKNFFK